jgi:hypothetical protein
MVVRLTAVVFCLACCAPPAAWAAPDVRRMWFTPTVVPETWTHPVTFEALITESPASVAFSYNGADRPMFDDGTNGDRVAGDGIWTVQFSATEILSKVTPAWVNRPFIGFCKPAGGGQFNIFAEVWTSSMGTVPTYVRNATTQQTTHLVNLVVSASEVSTPDYQELARKFYQLFPDNFDFLNFVFVAGVRGNSFHIPARNDVNGIGIAIFNTTSFWGSAGRLRGANIFLVSPFFDTVSQIFNHETGHQWINFLSGSPFASGIPHWPRGSVAANVMGFSIPGSGGVGGTYPFTFTPSGGGYVVGNISAAAARLFNSMELYIMGLIPPNEVGTLVVLNDQNYNVTVGEILQPSQIALVTVNDVIAVNGARVPDSTASPKAFTVATVVLSEQPLDTYAMSFYHWFARRASSTQLLPCAVGLVPGMTCAPFYVATGGRATMSPYIGVPFTDDPIIPGSTTISAEHVSELRTRIDGARAQRGLSAYGYIDPSPVGGATIVLARHVNEMRSALSGAYAAAEMAPPAFTDASLLGLPVRSVHITELRAAVAALEAAN